MREELRCGREVDNLHDPYAVSVLKRIQIVGHIPRSISRPCSVFLRSHGSKSRMFLKYFNSAISIQTITWKS